VISGQSNIKTVDEMLPEMLSGLGPVGTPDIAQLQALMQQVQGNAAMEKMGVDDDDDIPDLVGDTNFENAGADAAATVAKDSESKDAPSQ